MAKLYASLSTKDRRHAQDLVDYYARPRQQQLVTVALKQLSDAIQGSQELMQYVHSTKSRVKDQEHLRDKLYRKMELAKKGKKPFSITEKNLVSRINDLAGFRILHLHTDQIGNIDRALRAIFKEYRYIIVEGPTARTWDDEHRAFFRRMGIRPIHSPKMYTSVHYIVKLNNQTGGRCEIQVRTLAEELWGEVDHAMNYPHESSIRACREQIKVLARITSSCSRLVDSIFDTANSYKR